MQYQFTVGNKTFKLTLLLLLILLAACNMQPNRTTLEPQATTFPVEGVTAPTGLLKLGVDPNSSFWVADHALGFCRMDNRVINQATCRRDATSPGQPSFYRDSSTGAVFVFIPDNSSKSRGVWRHSFNPANQTISAGTLISAGLDPRSRPTATTLIGTDLYVGYIRTDVIQRVANATTTPSTAEDVTSTSDGGGTVGLASVGEDLYIADLSAISVVRDINNAGCSEVIFCLAEATSSTVESPTSLAAVGPDLFIGDLNSVLHYNTANESQEVWATLFSFPTAVAAVANGSSFRVYVGDDATAGELTSQGYVIEVARGGVGRGTGVPDAMSEGVKFAEGVTAPGGILKIRNDWWVSDHINGFCRLDPDSSNLLAITLSTCKTNQISPGGASFDPIYNFVYVPDNSARGDSVYRYPYNPTTRTLGTPVRINLRDAKSRPSATALRIETFPDKVVTKLFVSYVRRSKISVVISTFPTVPTVRTTPSTVTLTPTWASVGGRASESITLAKNALGQPVLYATVDTRVQQAKADCTAACTFTDTTIGSSSPSAIGSDGNNTLFIAEGLLGNTVLRYNVLTNTTEVLATTGHDDNGNVERNFKFISGFAVDVDSSGVVTHVYAADDPTAGEGPEGKVWKISNP